MQMNVGGTEKVIRIVIGLALLSLLFVLEGNVRWLGLIGLIPIGTALIGWCPVWAALGINTTGKSDRPGGAQ